MILSSRLQKIVKICLSDTNVTTQSLAKELGVSKRTIFRELKELEALLLQYQLTLNSKGRIQIIGDIGAKRELSLLVEKSTNSYITKEERQALISFEILQTKVVDKIIVYARRYQVSEGTISNDLIQIEKNFLTQQVKINRTAEESRIVGNEKNIRALLSRLLPSNIRNNTVNHSDLFQQLFSGYDDSIMKLLDREITERVLDVFEKHHRQLNLDKYVHSAYVGLIIHLTLSIARIRRNETIHNYEYAIELMRNESTYETAKKLAGYLEKEFEIIIPSSEIAYIAMHLQGSKLIMIDEVTREENEELIELCNTMINQYDCEYDLTQDKDLYRGLLAHLKPTMVRINNKMPIYNPLLEDIRLSHTLIFNQTQVMCEKIEEIYKVKFNDHEIGFISMHFGAAIERCRERNLERLPITIGVICSSGIGVSALLRAKIERITDSNVSVKSYALKDLERQKDSLDLIVSTFDLSYMIEEFIQVNHLLNEKDIQQIIKCINDARKSKHKNKPAFQKKSFEEIANAIAQMKLIIERLRVIRVQLDSFEDILQALREHVFNDADEQIYEKLKSREMKDSMIYPELNFGIVHLADELIKEEIVQILQPTRGSSLKVRFILLMFVNQHEKPSTLQLMSYISSSLIENDELFQAMDRDEEEIKEKLAQQFKKLIKEMS